MKLSRVLKTALAVLALAPALAWAAPPVPGDPGQGVAATAHDFTGGVMGTPNAGTVGVCTYCHTPHKAISTLLLWNHTLSSSNFSWDVPTTTAGTPFATFVGNTYKGPTTKCLSCHDGTVAVGDIAWFKEAARTVGSTDGVYNTFKLGSDGDTSHVIGATGGVAGAMGGNHPVAMPYSFNQAKNTYNSKVGGDGLVLTEWVAQPAAPIRLFNDNAGAISAGAVAGKTGIECSSCHDPHNKAAVDVNFLRGKLTGSTQADGYLCVQCHIK